MSNLSFSLLTPPTARFGPRLGTIHFTRSEGPEIQIQTPGFLTSTSRGVIPHLSRDHYASSAIRWVNLPFESFLDVLPPVPTLVPGKNPLHSFLGYSLGQHVVSLSVRDAADGREMPPNGNAHISAYSLRGVRKVSPADWKSYVYACKPDIVLALSDTPFINPPYSQKRLTKSIERSATWLANILSSSPPASAATTTSSTEGDYKPNVLVHMAGAASIPARQAFASTLLEKLFGPEADTIKPLQTLDEGIFGYTFDLVPLRLSLEAAEKKLQDPFYPPPDSPVPLTHPSASVATSASAPIEEVDLNPVLSSHSDQLSPLLRASLKVLPVEKVRVVNTAQTPHEIMKLISNVGVDVFDSYWAQRAADIGVALDFVFPAPSTDSSSKARENTKRDIGHNLYSSSYTHDFTPLSSPILKCECHACVPVKPATRIYHGIDDPSHTHEQPISPSTQRTKPAFTKAYIHHLLHTHEMSAHSLLVLHNLSVLDTFFASIRNFISRSSNTTAEVNGYVDGSTESKVGTWEEEVQRFEEYYDETLEVFDEAKTMWRNVDLARGKGRLAREKKKQEESVLGTSAEL